MRFFVQQNLYVMPMSISSFYQSFDLNVHEQMPFDDPKDLQLHLVHDDI